MKIIYTNAEGINNRVHYLILNIRYKNQLEPKGINSTILKGTKSRSLGRDNIYKRY